jgi:hypothetical protein
VAALEIEHQSVGFSALLGEFTDAVLECLGGGEEETTIQAQHLDTRECLVIRMFVDVAEHLCPGHATQ